MGLFHVSAVFRSWSFHSDMAAYYNLPWTNNFIKIFYGSSNEGVRRQARPKGIIRYQRRLIKIKLIIHYV
jgi:hypothetical protein